MTAQVSDSRRRFDMGRQSRSPAPDPFSYRQVPIYPEDFKPTKIGNFSAPHCRSTTQQHIAKYSLGASNSMNTIPTAPIAFEMEGTVPTANPGPWQVPLLDTGIASHASFTNANMYPCLPMPSGFLLGGTAPQMDPWQSQAAMCKNVTDATQAALLERNITSGAASMLPPNDHNTCNAFNSVDYPTYHNKPRSAATGMYKPFSTGSMDTLVATSPADAFSSTQLLWTEAMPSLMSDANTDSTCSSTREYPLSPQSMAKCGTYDDFHYAASGKLQRRSFSAESDATIKHGCYSGATPLALVSPLPDIESCLARDMEPAYIQTGNLIVDSMDSPFSTDLGDAARAPTREAVVNKDAGQKRTHDEVRDPQSLKEIDR